MGKRSPFSLNSLHRIRALSLLQKAITPFSLPLKRREKGDTGSERSRHTSRTTRAASLRRS
jgi:hypothetical protein